jgi:glycosyltransferase involved in cell wall biosynthesis
MKIGVCSPFMPHELEDLLDEESRAMLGQIKGVTATPVTPLVRAWHAAGHTLAVFCLDQSVTKPVRLTGSNITIDVLPKRRFRQSMMDCYRKERLLICEAIRRERPDVLSAQWSYEHALGALDSGVPTVVTCHDTPLRYAWISKSFFMTYHLFIAASVIRRADEIVCVSPYTEHHIQKIFRPRCATHVIANGLPAEMHLRGERRLAIQRESSGFFTLCSVGGWGGIKNLKSLLRAFSQVRSRYKDTRLVLFGSGLGASEEAEQWATEEKLTDGVEFRGSNPRETILEFLEKEADMMVHPSVVETHGMVLIEAMACGVPVVGGRSSGAVPWTLGDGEFGILCDVRNPVDLANTILHAMENRGDTSRIAERGYASVKERFNMEKTAADNLSILTELANVAN